MTNNTKLNELEYIAIHTECDCKGDGSHASDCSKHIAWENAREFKQSIKETKRKNASGAGRPAKAPTKIYRLTGNEYEMIKLYRSALDKPEYEALPVRVKK